MINIWRAAAFTLNYNNGAAIPRPPEGTLRRPLDIKRKTEKKTPPSSAMPGAASAPGKGKIAVFIKTMLADLCAPARPLHYGAGSDRPEEPQTNMRLRRLDEFEPD